MSETIRRTAEVRLTDPDLLEILDRVAGAIQAGFATELIFAAEGSAYPVLWLPLGIVEQAVPDGYGVGARIGSGGDPAMTYVMRDAHGRQAGRWLAPTFHTDDMVLERYVDNIVDALPFWALLNLVEIARGHGIIWGTENTGPAQRARLLELVRMAYEQIGSPRFDDALPQTWDPR